MAARSERSEKMRAELIAEGGGTDRLESRARGLARKFVAKA